MRSVLIASLLAIVLAIDNPLIWADVPDIDVIRVEDTYYMVSTTMFFAPGAPIMKSKDLTKWEMCGYVYETYADGDTQQLKNGKHDYSHGQWATSIRYHEGNFYVFFGSYGSGQSYIYKTDNIESGKWTRSAIQGMYHDASMIFNDDGKNYLVYGSGEIKIKQLNNDMTGFQAGGVDKTLFKTGLSGLAGEGSHILKIKDYYYIFIIAWPSGRKRIELAYRSKDILGNYESKEILDSGLGTYGSGVAQGVIVDTPDGNWWGIYFQDHGSVGRVPCIVPVKWQDNWPLSSAPITVDVPGASTTGTQLAVSDDFEGEKLKLEWQWNHNPDNNSWSLKDNPGFLRLKNNNVAKSIIHARNTLTMRSEGPSCAGWVKLNTKGMKDGDHAGLSAFQFQFGNVGVYVTGGQKKIYMSRNGSNGDILSSTDKKVAEQALTGDEVYLKVDFKFSNVGNDKSASNNIDKANFFYSTDGSSWTKIGDELGMSYDLKMFTGYRFGLYSYPTGATGGYADFDSFTYEHTTKWNGV